MTREEELINHIREYLNSEMWKYEACDLGNEDLELIVKALEQKQKTEWMPISEKLPEYETEVLTCRSDGYIEIQSIEHYGEYWENQHGDWTDFDEVIAWMPLPEGYKEKKESDE